MHAARSTSSYPSLDRPDEHRTDHTACEPGDKRDYRDRSDVHATLLRRADRLVLLFRPGGRLGEVPRQRP